MEIFRSLRKVVPGANAQSSGTTASKASNPRIAEMAPATTTTDDDDDTILPNQMIKTTYECNDVPVPAEFLRVAPPDARPVTLETIDWRQTELPEYHDCYAAVLDHVISPSECAELLRMAEQSVPASKRGKSGTRFWQPALVNAGNGYEVLVPTYRKSDRIIWDQQDIVDRLWERCLEAPGLKERLHTIYQEREMLGKSPQRQRWDFRRLNQRMRFLKYEPGGFFAPHCDGSYLDSNDPVVRTLFTIHLYLNDSIAEVGDEAELQGGATSFLSRDETRRLDVDPKAGRVLIFQHQRLYHSGADVLAGTKYTMRTDMLYELTETK